MSELLDILDESGSVIGSAERTACHRGTMLLHGAVHILVFDRRGRLLLQKRAPTKEIQPGKWDTSVGGHIGGGESVIEAVYREAAEELGLTGMALEELYRYRMENEVERELVTTYRCHWDGRITPCPDEIEDTAFLTPDEIESRLGDGGFTPNFEDEWRRYTDWVRAGGQARRIVTPQES